VAFCSRDRQEGHSLLSFFCVAIVRAQVIPDEFRATRMRAMAKARSALGIKESKPSTFGKCERPSQIK